MSTLFVNNLNTASGSTITVPTGKRIVGTDNSSIVAPGMVIQVVNGGTGVMTRTATTSTTYVATAINALINPKFANSLILPHFVTTANTNQSNGNGEGLIYTLFRKIGSGSFTELSTGSQGIGQLYSTYSRTHSSITASKFDTPNTTEQVEYKVYMKRIGSVGSVEIPATANVEHAVLAIFEIAQ